MRRKFREWLDYHRVRYYVGHYDKVELGVILFSIAFVIYLFIDG